MKLILTALGVILLIIAGVYFLIPADQLPAFLPGHEAGVAHVTPSTALSPPSQALCCWQPASGWAAGEGPRHLASGELAI